MSAQLKFTELEINQLKNELFGVRGFESLTLRENTPDNQSIIELSDKNRTVMPQYKLLKAYDAGGDLKKEWFVKYQFLKPHHLQKSGEPIYERFKVSKTINCYHTARERRERLKIVLAGMKILLDRGFNPYQIYSHASYVDYSDYSIASCIDKYFSDIKRKLAPNTIRKYKERVYLFHKWLEKNSRQDITIHQITKTDISNFLSDAHKEYPDWSNKTYNHYLTDLRTFFNHFKKNYENYVERNPADHIKKLRVDKKGNRPFANDDLKRVLDYAQIHDYELYIFSKFLYYSCCRPDSEARLMKRSYFDLQRKSMMVPGEISKNGVTQYVPIDDEFMKLLIDKIKIQNIQTDHYVFGTGYTPATTPIYAKAFSRKFLKVKNALKIHTDNTLYSFKHTRACHLVEDEVPLYRIQNVTRHLTLAALMDYLKDLNAVIDKPAPIKSRAI